MSQTPLEGREPEGRYANYFEVGFNEYEFIIDFGQQYPPGGHRIHTRIVTTPLYARNLRDVLSKSLYDHDQHRGQEHELAP